MLGELDLPGRVNCPRRKQLHRVPVLGECELLKAAHPLMRSALRLHCACVSFINRFSIVLVLCIQSCDSARASDVLALC